MKAIKTFLSFYSIIVITVLSIGSVFFLPKPYGYIHTALFFPIAIYLWIKVSGPKDVTSGQWSVRFLIIVLMLSALGIFGSYLTSYLPQPEKTVQEESSTSLSDIQSQLEQIKGSESKDELVNRLADIEKAIAELKSQKDLDMQTLSAQNEEGSLMDILNKQEELPTGYVTIKSSYLGKVEIFEEANSKSKVIGKASYGTSYPFYSSHGSWYEIDISEDNSVLVGYNRGYVRAEFVREVTESE